LGQSLLRGTHLAEIAGAACQVAVTFAVNGAVDVEGLLVVVLGLGVIALGVEGVGEGGETIGEVSVAGAAGGPGGGPLPAGQGVRPRPTGPGWPGPAPGSPTRRHSGGGVRRGRACGRQRP